MRSIIEEKYFEKLLKQPLPFDNTEYELRISGTVETDKRVMSFIDPLWGVEVTGKMLLCNELSAFHLSIISQSGFSFHFKVAAINTNRLLFYL